VALSSQTVENDKGAPVIEKTTDKYQTNVVGVISTDPGITLGQETGDRPVALAGRVPVKVTAENGNIQKGDMLVPASKQGYAMKACGEQYCKAGIVVGMAMESFTANNFGDSQEVKTNLEEKKEELTEKLTLIEETAKESTDSAETVDQQDIEKIKEKVEYLTEEQNTATYGEGRVMMLVKNHYFMGMSLDEKGEVSDTNQFNLFTKNNKEASGSAILNKKTATSSADFKVELTGTVEDQLAIVGPLLEEIGKETQIQRVEIDGINTNLSNIQGEVAGVQTRIGSLNSSLSTVSGQVATVSTDVENVRNELLSLTSLNTKFVDLDKKLTEISEQTTTKITQLELDIENLQDATADLDELRQKIKDLETQVLGASGSATIDTSTDSGTLITAEQDATFNSLTVTGDSNLYNLAVAGNLTAGVIAVDGEEGSIGTLAQPLKLQPLGIEGIEMVGGKVNIDKDGNISLQEGIIEGNENMRNSVKLKKGETEIKVSAEWKNKPETVIVTATYKAYAWVEEVTEEGFVIKVDMPPEEDREIYWQALW
jgi:hypothetical protein